MPILIQYIFYTFAARVSIVSMHKTLTQGTGSDTIILLIMQNIERCGMLFGKKNRSSGMDIKALRALDKKAVKYVTERDSETMRELKTGGEGAINVSDTEFTVVCGGVNAIRCSITEVNAAELMNKSGLTIKGKDLDTGRQKSVIAYYSDGTVSADRKR